jgi:hypothetical protein
MPARQRGEPYKLGKGRWGLRYYDESGRRRRQSGFTSRTEALDWFETVERKRQLGLPVAAPDTTFGQFVDRYLRAHGATRSPRTITILRERLGYALACWADTPLAQLSPGEIADWQATLPERSRYGIVQALRQALQAAVRWEAIGQNPAGGDHAVHGRGGRAAQDRTRAVGIARCVRRRDWPPASRADRARMARR